MDDNNLKDNFFINPKMIQFEIKKMLQYTNVKPQSLQKIPQSFYAFAKQRGLNIEQLAQPIPRYIRLKPSCQISNEELALKLGINLKEIVKVDKHFWAINAEAKINKCPLYQEGLLYGMDYSSAIPTKCLQITPGSLILEICSAPGNKSMLMADSYDNVKIKAIQINQNRANIMNNLVKKYKLQDKIQVMICDGLTYQSQYQFDRVLVDAQCTHQGSLKHIHKFFKEDQNKNEIKKNKVLSKQQEKQYKMNNTNPYTSEIIKKNQWTKEDFQERFLDTYKIANLQTLQTGLLQNGFKLLKQKGIIVYSTCSFDSQQNEQIIRKFLDKHNEEAELMDAADNLQCGVPWKYGDLKGTLRFSPSISLCGGMFIAKIKKL